MVKPRHKKLTKDTDNQKPTFENSDRVPPALKRVKFLIKNKETSIPQVEKNTNDQNPTFENSDIVPPAPKKVKISMKKEKTPTKSNTLADALPAPKRKSKRAAKKSGRAISDETGSGGSGSRQSGSGQDGSGETGSGETGSGEIDSGEVGSEELGSGEIGSTEPGHDDEAISFATHRLNDAFNSVDEESVIWKLTHHFSKEQVSSSNLHDQKVASRSSHTRLPATYTGNNKIQKGNEWNEA
ncbi:hypothetical protein EYC84_008570 [Monilinia fructicola]|uniref:Uncharacterized protein n=1 Tax=Monilinia fructicola TaxID=38448 RepID=A0A5M9JMA2_MONFR|nr:hypothetical protein EYC84_008570 [Monilinia fructicola]